MTRPPVTHLCQRPGCAAEFVSTAYQARYCSLTCRRAVGRDRKAAGTAVRRPRHDWRSCMYCGRRFSYASATAKYCRPAHRQAAYKARLRR